MSDIQLLMESERQQSCGAISSTADQLQRHQQSSSNNVDLDRRRVEELEAQLLGTGPLAPKTKPTPAVVPSERPFARENVPTTSSASSSSSAATLANDCVSEVLVAVRNTQQQQQQQQLQQLNESSNLSSAGSVASDERERLAAGEPDTPEKANETLSQQANSKSAPATAEKTTRASRPRKRKKTSGDDASTSYGPQSAAGKQGAPKSVRKISEFYRRTSPPMKGGKWSAAAERCRANNNAICGLSPALQKVVVSEDVNGSSAGRRGAVTPTGMSDASSSSNHSPPSSSATTIAPSSSSTSHPQSLLGCSVRTMGGAVVSQVELESAQEQLRIKNLKMADMERTVDDLRSQLRKIQQKMEEQSNRIAKGRDVIKQLLIEQSTMERKEAKQRCMEKCLRLGQFRPERKGVHFEEAWVEGFAFQEIDKKLSKNASEKNDIQQATLQLKKRRPSIAAAAREARKQQGDGCNLLSGPSCSTTAVLDGSATDDSFVRPPEPPREMSLHEYHEQDEIYRLRREQLKREECELLAEKDRLERERNLHIKELRRIQTEEASRYRDHQVLNSRYLLLTLLGKGGFSEVWRAFDLDEYRYVACKIHHVNHEWKEDRKANYVRHAMREKDIHKTLNHDRIVSLLDVFYIDNHYFCTVLEFCPGNDLEFYLKQNKTIPEKEARSIIMQVVSALKYLNLEIKPPVIHYDLKPANILLQTGTTSGEIKITDFGLSKVMEDDKYDPAVGMDLTSQGAGTYWYLPPECFVIGNRPPKISAKVDIWSVGVIFYQCLYGKRPFGHDQTQTKILEENTILKAQEVLFPNKPTVSAEAKSFIKRCLQYNKEERADVWELYNHDYLRPKSKTAAAAAAAASLQPPSPLAPPMMPPPPPNALNL